ncbi:phage portal protein [Devriesea agamarum]|uniref:phage portal protein n=1 Tax=Devriesea agamarum TaxID=472569 RepID=UPI0012ED3F51|nr:phage portal protein [Devriesea agamarum]
MGLVSFFGNLMQSVLRAGRTIRARTTFMGREVDIFAHDLPTSDPSNMSVEDLWATQPHLRTVIDFRARNIAQLGMQLFEANGEERRRVRDNPVATILRKPNPYMTGYELLYDLVATKSLYDTAYWFIAPADSGYVIHPFPPPWVTPMADSHFSERTFRLQPPGSDRYIDLPEGSVVEFRGWTPTPSLSTSSPVETLRMVLEEQYSSRKHRLQLWKRNGRVGAYASRPVNAPTWDNTARRRFYDMLEAFVGDKGPRADGIPLLEDGTELKRLSFSSADEQWAESVKLSLETVAQVYQVNPAMVGALDNTNYSNMQEFNRALYRTSLGPDIRSIEDRVSTFVLPLLDAPDNQYIKLNVESMLRGSFEEQASFLSTAIGKSWMSTNEGRARFELPPVPGGDELVTPLNVTVGGQASPQDGGDGRPPGS